MLEGSETGGDMQDWKTLDEMRSLVRREVARGSTYRAAVRAALDRDDDEVEVPLVLLAVEQQRMAVAATC